MRLGPKSRNLLSILAALGAEALEAAFCLPRFYALAGYTSRKSFLEQVKLLEGREWVVWDDNRSSGKWTLKVTQAGRGALRLVADPEALWNEPWDKQWRLLSFDLPRRAHPQRRALQLWIESMRFGRLQGSVFISPRSLGGWMEDLAKLKIDPGAVVFMLGRFGGANEDRRYVGTAWNFDRINESYKAYLSFLKAPIPAQPSAESLFEWFSRELALWDNSSRMDPFLPRELWPSGWWSSYLGPTAWEARGRALRAWELRLMELGGATRV